MNITTKHTSNASGRGGVIATGTVSGKRHQVTTPWDHSVSAAKNHGRAAAAFVRKNIPMGQWDKVAARATHRANADQSHTFIV